MLMPELLRYPKKGTHAVRYRNVLMQDEVPDAGVLILVASVSMLMPRYVNMLGGSLLSSVRDCVTF